MRAVNLLPADLSQSRRFAAGAGPEVSAKRALQTGGAAAAALAAAFVGLYVHERSVVHGKRTSLNAVQARIVAVQAQVQAIQAEQSAANTRLTAIRTVVESRMNWDRAMGDLAHVLPGDVYLTNLAAAAPVSPASAAAATAAVTPTGPSTLQLSGVAPSHDRVALVLDRLALLPWLSDVTLTSSSRATDGTVDFNLTANVSEEH